MSILVESSRIPEFQEIPAESIGIPGFWQNLWRTEKHCSFMYAPTPYQDTSGILVYIQYIFFNIQFIVHQGGASCWTLHIVYATPLAPMPVLPLPLWPSSASAQGTPLVIAPHANPAQKCCFWMHHSRIVCRCSTVFFVVF